MSQIKFVRPPHHAQSYADLWRLVQLAGYPIVEGVDPDSGDCYILSTHDNHWWGGWQNPKSRIIYWDIEFYPDADLEHIPGVEVWTCDAAYASWKNVRFVPMGSDERLAGYVVDEPVLAAELSATGEALRDPPVPQWLHTPINREMDKQYDVALLAYMPWRRQVVEGQLRDLGVSIAPNAWGRERHVLLQQSRAMLIIHQRDEYQAIAPQRMALAAAYKLPVIMENVSDLSPFSRKDVCMVDYGALALTAHALTRPIGALRLNGYGAALHDLLCHRMKFRDIIEASV